MKKTILAFTFIISSMFLHAEVVIKTYCFAQPKVAVTDGYQTFSFENCYITAPAGEPAMPYQSVALLLPPGHIATDIQITTGEEILLGQNFNIYPMQHAQPLSKGASGIFVKNETLYGNDAWYPDKPNGKITTQFLNGYAIALCSFTPLRYNPVSGNVTFYKSVTVKISTTEDEKSLAALQHIHPSQNHFTLLQNTVQNSEAVSSYPKPTFKNDIYDLLIIAPQMFANDFGQLINFYLPRGVVGHFAGTEEIFATMPGQDNPEKIRNYIIQEYQNHNIQHVTLGGDIEHIPYRGFYCGVQSSSWYEDSNIPSDLYYAALDGNWNNDGDNRWGEIGEDDLLPEIGIGRMSFSTGAELNAMINKTIQYQQNPVLGELDNPLLVGEFLYDNPETWGSDYLELLVGYHNDNGYQTTGIPESQNIEKLYESEVSWDKNALRAQMNLGSSFIHHVGHANATYAMKFSMSDITDANFSGVNGSDHNFALIFSHGCICGAFDNSDCIAEKMTNLNNLAVAVYMNSRYGWFNEGQTEGPAAHLNRELADAFYDKKEAHLGMAFTLARIATAPWVTAPGQWEEGALRWNFYDCNLLGDAAIRFWPDEPIEITANYNNVIPTGTTTFDITIAGSENVQGLYCHFMIDSISYGIAQTNENGFAEILFAQPLNDTGTAMMYVSGYDCQLHEFPVHVIQNSITHFQPLWTNPYNPMSFFVQEALIDDANMQGGDEIGVFDTDPNTGQDICVGAAILTEELTNGTYLTITASMNDGSNPDIVNGFAPGNEIKYKLWTEETGELGIVTAVYPFAGYDEVFTSLGNAIVNLSAGVSQTTQHIITLGQGWTGISSYLIPLDTNMENLFETISGQVVIVQNTDAFYQPDDPSTTLQNWNYQSGYLIKVNENTGLTIEGVLPAEKTINMVVGWNLIPVLSDQLLTIENLFSGNLNKIEIIKDAIGLQVYWPAQSVFTLQTLYPGSAYLVKVSESFSIAY